MTVLCVDCDNIHSDTRKQPPFRWRCLKRPMPLETPAELLFVDPKYLVNPPYSLCTNANRDGECEHFTPRRGEANEHR